METVVHMVDTPQLSAEAEALLGALEQNTGSQASVLLQRSIQLLGDHSKTDDEMERDDESLPDGLSKGAAARAETEEKFRTLQFTYGVMIRGAILLESRSRDGACIRAQDLQSGANLLRWVRGKGGPWATSIREAAADLAEALCSTGGTGGARGMMEMDYEIDCRRARGYGEEVGSRQESEEWTQEGMEGQMEAGDSPSFQQVSSRAASGNMGPCALTPPGDDEAGPAAKLSSGSGRPESSDDAKDGDSRAPSASGSPRYSGDGRPVVLSRSKGLFRSRHSNSPGPKIKRSFSEVPLVRSRVAKKRATLLTILPRFTQRNSPRPEAPERAFSGLKPIKVRQEKQQQQAATRAAPAAKAAKGKGGAAKKAQGKGMSVEALRKAEAHCPCVSCGTRHTPQWRRGPDGELNMCNACGVRLRKGTLRRK